MRVEELSFALDSKTGPVVVEYTDPEGTGRTAWLFNVGNGKVTLQTGVGRLVDVSPEDIHRIVREGTS